MAIHIAFDSTCGILRTRAVGKFDTNEYREALNQITSGKDYPPTVPTIWDLREFDFSQFDRQLAQNVRAVLSSFEIRKGTKNAIVVSTPLGYGMARMIQILSGIEDDSLVCYKYDEAEQWLLRQQ